MAVFVVGLVFILAFAGYSGEFLDFCGGFCVLCSMHVHSSQKSKRACVKFRSLPLFSLS